MSAPFSFFARFAALGGIVLVAGWLWLHEALPRLTPPEVPSEVQVKAPLHSAEIAALRQPSRSLIQALEQGAPLWIPADGQAQPYVLSLSHLHLPGRPLAERIASFAPVRSSQALIQQAEKLGEPQAEWIFYPAGHEGELFLRHVLKNRMVVEIADASAAEATLRSLKLRVVERPDYAPGCWILEPVSKTALDTLVALDQIAGRPGIRTVSALMGRQRQKEFIPNDPLFTQQWHLKNTGQGGGRVGFDINVTNVWDTLRGGNVQIGIVDDGLDLQHPDLVPNLDLQNGYDWNDYPPDRDPSAVPHPVVNLEDAHGTCVAGLAAARGGNGAGVSGVAPMATLIGLRLISELSTDPDGTTDQDEAEAMAYQNQYIDIKNNSWSSGFPANVLAPLGPLTRAAVQTAASEGRGGRGMLMIWAAGNNRADEQQGQKDGYTNNMYGLTVAAVTNQGNLSSYSEGGPHIVVSAPSNGGTRSMSTTDLRGNNGYNRAGPLGGQLSDRNYSSSFGGTSAATPVISGVTALLLNANPQLNWRDVKEIFLRTSVRINSADTTWVSRHGGDPSLPLIQHHEDYGGGRVDAAAAVAMAQTWPSLGPMQQRSRSHSGTIAIPDAPDSGTNVGISIPLDFTSLTTLRVEHATLSLRVTHTFRGDLSVRLISPTGVISNLAVRSFADNSQLGYNDWVFTSVRHWGESSHGVWTLNIRDLARRDVGSYQASTLTLHGTPVSTPMLTSQTSGPIFLRAGSPLLLEGQGAGEGRLAYLWSRENTVLPGNNARLEIPEIQLSQAGNYRLNVVNAAGSATSEAIAVGVVGDLPASELAVQGKRFQLSAPAAGPGLTYQWLRDNQPLTNEGNLSGATSALLVIDGVSEAHSGSYACRVGMAGLATTYETSALTLNVLLKPVMNPPAIGNVVRGSSVRAAFAATQSPTSYRLRGKLPTGIRFNAVNGELTGRPTTVGTHTLYLSAVNAAGTSDEIEFVWTVEEFPPELVGSWRGLVARQADTNAQLGGSLSLTVSPTGSFSARLTQGARAFAWSGQLDAKPAKAAFATPFSLSRGTNLAPLVGSFTLDPLSGLLSGSCGHGSPGTGTALTGFRSPWRSTLKPVTATTVFNTAFMLPLGSLEERDIAYPHGVSWAVLSLSPTGSLSWSGRMADDTLITGSTLLGPSGQWFMHQMLYANTGSVWSASTLTLGTGLVDGTLTWLKQPALRNPPRNYGNGIPLHTLQTQGALYVRPARDQMLLSLSPPGVFPQELNARLLFQGESLTQPLEQSFQVTLSGTARVPTPLALNPQSVRLSLTGTDGRFSGSFSFRDPHPWATNKPAILRTATFRGLILQRSGLQQGIGYFILPRLPEDEIEPVTATPILSGKVELLPP